MEKTHSKQPTKLKPIELGLVGFSTDNCCLDIKEKMDSQIKCNFFFSFENNLLRLFGCFHLEKKCMNLTK